MLVLKNCWPLLQNIQSSPWRCLFGYRHKHLNRGVEKHNPKTGQRNDETMADNKPSSASHMYRNLHPCKTNRELAEYLKLTEVYHEGDLIVVNRPYGIPKTASTSKNIKTSINTGGLDFYNLSVEDTLPHLKTLYDTNHIEAVSAMDRWTSGILLLSKSEKMTNRINKCLRRISGSRETLKHFWALTLGQPNQPSLKKKVGITLKYVDAVGKMPVFCTEYSKNSLKRRETKIINVEHDLLEYSPAYDVSLVEVRVTSTSHHFLRLWMANNYSPVLGDFLCGGRVKSLQGVKILSNINLATSYDPPILPSNITNILNLRVQTMDMLPCHLHFARLTLKGFYPKDHKDRDLVLFAPPPDHFKWSCKQMEIDLMKREELNEKIIPH